MAESDLGIVLEEPPRDYVRPAGLASLGPNSRFGKPYWIRSPHRIHIGRNIWFGPRACLSVAERLRGEEFEPVLRFGDDCDISTDLFVSCLGEITIGNRVGLGTRVYIGDSFTDYSDPDAMPEDMKFAEPKPVRIEDGAIVGAGAAVLPGVTIGARAIVAANAVVTRDVPPRAVVLGNPARTIRTWDEQSSQWVAGP